MLGLTATPDRGDAVALGHVFDAVAYEYTIADAIDDGWLVPVRQRFVKVESLNPGGSAKDRVAAASPIAVTS